MPYPSTAKQGLPKPVLFGAECPSCGHPDATWTNMLVYGKAPRAAISCDGCRLEVTWDTGTGQLLSVIA